MYFYDCMSTILVIKNLAPGSNTRASKSLSPGPNFFVSGRKNFSKVLLLLFALLFTALPDIRGQIRFEQGSSFRYLKGNANHQSPETLFSRDYDDSQWSTGPAPFRYGKGSGGTVLSDMQNNYTCFYLRCTFRAENVDKLEQLHLSINYDDGFVIAINGQIVLKQNVPETVSNNSLALQNHDPGTNESFVLNAMDIPLVEGDNSLAVMVLNVSSHSSDIHFDLGHGRTRIALFPTAATYKSVAGRIYGEAFTLTLDRPYPPRTNIPFSTAANPPLLHHHRVARGEWLCRPTQPILERQTRLMFCLPREEGYKPQFPLPEPIFYRSR